MGTQLGDSAGLLRMTPREDILPARVQPAAVEPRKLHRTQDDGGLRSEPLMPCNGCFA